MSCLSRMHFFYQKYSKISNSVICSFDGKVEFSAAITPVLNVTRSFRNHSNTVCWFAAKKTLLSWMSKGGKICPPPQVCFDEKRVLKNLKFEICYTFWSVSNWLNKEHKLLNRSIDKHTIAGFDLFYASLSQWPCHSVVLELCAYFMLFCCSFMACNLFCFLFCLVLKASFTN